MYPRTDYEMTEDDLKSILEASRPVLAMMLTGGMPMFGTPQDNANAAWSRLGEKMGFDYMTVRPVDGKSQRFFTAVPSETPDQRKERIQREIQAARKEEIKKLNAEIAERQKRLDELHRTIT